MSTPAGPPRRVRVTGPRAARRRTTTVASEIDAQTELGEVFMRSLVRSQLRLAVGTLLALAATVGMLPVLFTVVPELNDARLAGVPLPWLLLGVGCYPLLIGLATVYVRRAERNEARFHELVADRDGPPDEEPV